MDSYKQRLIVHSSLYMRDCFVILSAAHVLEFRRAQVRDRKSDDGYS